jgi:hypothetical protein
MNYQEYTVKVFDNGNKYWYKNDQLHRLDGPAQEFANGDKCWYKNGKYHRLDGPAWELDDGRKHWYINGKELSEQEFNELNNSYEGKIVEIGGKKYRLTEI